MSHAPKKKFWSRRDFLMQSGGGIAGLALASMLDKDGVFAQQPSLDTQCSAQFPGAFEPKQPHFAPRAKNVISLFMSGGPSQLDTFDYKPALTQYAGVPLEDLIGENLPCVRASPGPLIAQPV